MSSSVIDLTLSDDDESIIDLTLLTDNEDHPRILYPCRQSRARDDYGTKGDAKKDGLKEGDAKKNGPKEGGWKEGGPKGVGHSDDVDFSDDDSDDEDFVADDSDDDSEDDDFSYDGSDDACSLSAERVPAKERMNIPTTSRPFHQFTPHKQRNAMPIAHASSVASNDPGPSSAVTRTGPLALRTSGSSRVIPNQSGPGPSSASGAGRAPPRIPTSNIPRVIACMPKGEHVTFQCYIDEKGPTEPLLDNRASRPVTDTESGLPPKPVVVPFTQATFEQAISTFLVPKGFAPGRKRWLDDHKPSDITMFMKHPKSKQLLSFIMSLTVKEAREVLPEAPTLALLYYIKNAYPFFYSHTQEIWHEDARSKHAFLREIGHVAQGELSHATWRLKTWRPAGNNRSGTLGSLAGRFDHL